MAKNDKKIKTPVPSGLSEQVGAMIEHFDNKLSLVAEHVSHIDKEVVGIKKTLDRHSESIAIIQMDIEFIKSGLKKKVDAEEFTALEHRVSLLENRG